MIAVLSVNKKLSNMNDNIGECMIFLNHERLKGKMKMFNIKKRNKEVG